MSGVPTFSIMPALEAFQRNPSKQNVNQLYTVITQMSLFEIKMYHSQILVPLVVYLGEPQGVNQDVQAGSLNCIQHIVAKIFVTDDRAMRTILVIALNQLRDCGSASMKPNLSEELKQAAIECISETLKRSSTDILEKIYNEDSTMLAHILLMLVEIIENEKYKTLVLEAMHCVMVVFYVHDGADCMDVVLRKKVADRLFIFMPKVTTVLFKECIGDEKLGELAKCIAIKALGRILCVLFEETNGSIIGCNYSIDDFKKLVKDTINRKLAEDLSTECDLLGAKNKEEDFLDHMKKLQGAGRSPEWMEFSAGKLQIIFEKTCLLRSNASKIIRQSYAEMCCLLTERCSHNLKINVVLMLESMLAMLEDEDKHVRNMCGKSLEKIQFAYDGEGIFDDSCDMLFDEHLLKLPRILNRCDDDEQYAELLFLKSFLRTLSDKKLQILLSIEKNVTMFTACLIEAADLEYNRDLLNEEYSLRTVTKVDIAECQKLKWRRFKKLCSPRCVKALSDICDILGSKTVVNRIIFEELLQLVSKNNKAMNEIILLMTYMSTGCSGEKSNHWKLAEMLMGELLYDKHWHLAVQPDEVFRLKVDKPTNWFVDRTPGLYESAIEIRVQDCDSDDEICVDTLEDTGRYRVTMTDAQYNVLHTCIVLDAVGHCASFFIDAFDKYMFRVVHQVLLKVANSNTMIYEAAVFALSSIQRALKFNDITQMVESHLDYIIYHLNMTLKKSPESRSAIEILTVVLQFSSSNALPHLKVVSDTIFKECSKVHNSENIASYLKVFKAFVTYACAWQKSSEWSVDDIVAMPIDGIVEMDLASNWLNILNKSYGFDPSMGENCISSEANSQSDIMMPKKEENSDENLNYESDTKPVLPAHIEVVKNILEQVLQFISSVTKDQQILALECFITGLPLLKHYENELLPMVHSIWPLLVEKFRQRDAVVMNRCFTLLNIVATYAKEFILKRSLSDVIPFLKQFLKEAAVHSSKQNVELTSTQEYKLQVKLLQEFPNIIQSIQIDGKQLNDIAEEVSPYLSRKQPKELQQLAVQFYKVLRRYDGPLIYIIVSCKSHLTYYKESTAKILAEFKIE